MIEAEILKSLLRNSEKDALAVTVKYGLRETLLKIIGTTVENFFLRLISNLDKGIEKALNQRHEEYITRSNYIKQFSIDLNKNNVQHCIFKGAAYSLNLYSHITDRPYTDFDIIISNKSFKNFYYYLDKTGINHRNNISFINRLGYTRNALEVSKSDLGIPFDFHYRVVNKFHEKTCPLTVSSLANIHKVNDIYMPDNESLISITMYNSFRQNGFDARVINLIDVNKLIESGFDKDRTFALLSKTKNLTSFLNVMDALNNINQNVITDRESKIIKRAFSNEKNKSVKFSTIMVLTQIAHILDPEPYLNYAGGSKEKNRYIELVKTKISRGKIRLD